MSKRKIITDNVANSVIKSLPLGIEKLKEIDPSSVIWKSIKQNGLDLEYAVPIPKTLASNLFRELDETLEYFTGNLSKIK